MYSLSRLSRIICLCLVFLLWGCSATSAAVATSPTPTLPGILTPYRTETPAPLPSGEPPTGTPIPSPTPTPVFYQVKKDDDMFGIALRYGIPLAALQTANPSVNPNWMSVGQQLVIPITVTPTPVGTNSPGAGTPTPAPVSLGQPACYPAQDGGVWCLVSLKNTSGQAVENLSARIRMVDRSTGASSDQTAISLLDHLPVGGTTALSAYFPAPAPAAFGADAQLLEAQVISTGNERYLDAQTDGDPQIQINSDGLSAHLSGAVKLGEGNVEAARVWIAAVAYSPDNRPVGMRKWESKGGLKPGEKAPFELDVYSLGPAISRVEIQVEAAK